MSRQEYAPTSLHSSNRRPQSASMLRDRRPVSANKKRENPLTNLQINTDFNILQIYGGLVADKPSNRLMSTNTKTYELANDQNNFKKITRVRPSSAHVSRNISESKKMDSTKSTNIENNKEEIEKKYLNRQLGVAPFHQFDPSNKNILSYIPAVKHVISARFLRDSKRIQLLWEELQIPERDREFFQTVYMTKISHENTSMICDQLSLLSQHRDNTMDVLRCLKERKEIFILFYNHIQRAEVIYERSEINSWRKNMVRFIRALRSKTLELIESVVVWRMLLWRPSPFLWHKENVLITIVNEIEEMMRSRNGEIALSLLKIKIKYFPLFLTYDDGDDDEDKSLSILDINHRERINNAKVVLVNEKGIQENLVKEEESLISLGYYVPTMKWTPSSTAIDLWINNNKNMINSNTSRNFDGTKILNSDCSTKYNNFGQFNEGEVSWNKVVITGDTVDVDDHNMNVDNNNNNNKFWRKEVLNVIRKLPPMFTSHIINVFEEGITGDINAIVLFFHLYNPESNWVGNVSINLNHSNIPNNLRSKASRDVLVHHLLDKLIIVKDKLKDCLIVQFMQTSGGIIDYDCNNGNVFKNKEADRETGNISKDKAKNNKDSFDILKYNIQTYSPILKGKGNKINSKNRVQKIVEMVAEDRFLEEEKKISKQEFKARLRLETKNRLMERVKKEEEDEEEM